MDEVTFEVAGIPPTPNSRRHWTRRRKDDAQWRGDAWKAALDARNRSGLAGFPWEQAEVRYTFFVGSARRRDIDNLIAAAKPVLDGAVDAKLLADDSTRCIVAFGPHDVVVRPGSPGVRVAVRRA